MVGGEERRACQWKQVVEGREEKGRGIHAGSNRWQVRESTPGKVRMAESIDHHQNNKKKHLHTNNIKKS